jgi:hypothetical protein
MSLATPFEEARAALGLDAAERDPAAIKRAYRRAVAAHPPDRDPEAFRRVRNAYELLTDKGERAQELLLHTIPLVPPPAPPDSPLPAPPQGATAVALLRALAGRIEPEAWLTGPKERPSS